jgi:hypothetical protein
MLVRLLGVLVSPPCHQPRPVEVVLDSRHMVTSSSPHRLPSPILPAAQCMSRIARRRVAAALENVIRTFCPPRRGCTEMLLCRRWSGGRPWQPGEMRNHTPQHREAAAASQHDASRWPDCVQQQRPVGGEGGDWEL